MGQAQIEQRIEAGWSMLRQKHAPLLPLPADPWEFCVKCAFTQDEHAKAKGLEYIRPLVGPGDDYLELIISRAGTAQMLRIEKSRQLRVTWLLSALFMHHVLTQPGSRLGYVCRGFESADAYLRDRMWFIFEHLPAEYAKPRARYVSGVIEVFHPPKSISGMDSGAKAGVSFTTPSISSIPTAQIMALAEGENQVRQYTFTRLWADEFGMQYDQDEFLTGSKPSLDGGGQLLLTCSAAGDGNAFYRTGHETISPGPVTEPQEVIPGVKEWQRNGYTNLRVHYLADPHKRGDWAAKAKQGYTPQAWAQEQEIDFTVSTGKPVWDCLNLIEAEQFYNSKLPVLSGLDYSFLANVCLSSQIRQRADGRYSLHILNTTDAFGCYIEPFAEQIKADRVVNFPNCREFRDYGDYSANQRTSTGTINEAMTNAGLPLSTVPTGPGGVLKGNELVQHLITQGLLEVDPGNKGLLKAMRAGYIFVKERYDAKGLPVPTTEHPAADYAHALRYLVVNTFELQDKPGGGYLISIKGMFRGSESERPATANNPRPAWRAVYADDPDGQKDLPPDVIPTGQFRGGSHTPGWRRNPKRVEDNKPGYVGGDEPQDVDYLQGAFRG